MLGDSAYITKENLLFIIDDIGDRLMPLVTDPELAQKSPAVQALLAEQKQFQEQLKAQQERLIAEREQHGKLEGKQEGELRGKQQSLLMLLKRRFSELPEGVVERVEATTDMAQLERWLEQAFDGDSLAEMGLVD